MANQYKNKVVFNGNTLIDLTSDTVTAATLLSGITAHNAAGELITGTASGGGSGVTQDANGYIILPTEGGGGGGGSSATQHVIHLEFSDSTDTDIDVYYDDSLIGTMITAYEPATYGGKTVTLAQLDNVTWYEPANIPIGVQLVDYTAVKSGYVVDESTGEEVVSQWSCCSDFILVDPTMTFSYVAYRWYNIVFYNSSKTYLDKLYLDNDYDSLDGDYAHGSLTPAKFPSGTAYVRLTTYPNTGITASEMSLIRTV